MNDSEHLLIALYIDQDPDLQKIRKEYMKTLKDNHVKGVGRVAASVAIYSLGKYLHKGGGPGIGTNFERAFVDASREMLTKTAFDRIMSQAGKKVKEERHLWKCINS